MINSAEDADAGMPDPNYTLLKVVAKYKVEREMYDPFVRIHADGNAYRLLIKCLNVQIKAMQPYLKSGWTLVNTSNHVDPATSTIFGERSIKPDVGLYPPGRRGNEITDASEAELFGEFKISVEDEPFRVKADRNLPFQVDTPTARDTRGQIALYINAIQATQQRTRVFFFYIRANLYRLFCHSHAGTLVTPLFHCTI